MTTNPIESLRARLSRIKNRYDAHFAGQPRHTRDPGMLEDMVREIDEIIAASNGLEVGLEQTVLESLNQDRTLYQNEILAIREIQSAAPGVLLAHEYQTWVWLIIGRYRRNFAGRSRSSRDLGMLHEMADELKVLDGKLATLFDRTQATPIPRIREDIKESLELYQTEVKAIVDARSSGSREEQASRLAGAANAQFDQYRQHFSGKSRLSRDIRLMERIISQVTDIGEQMVGLRNDGFASENNDGNIDIVANRKSFYVGELSLIRDARQNTTFDQLVTSLGEAANAIFDEYRAHFGGQDRMTRELDRLNHCCEGLYYLARQMNDLDDVREHDVNQENLATVLDHLRIYDREHQAIAEAQSGS
ncbi:MAG: hypothetical protein VX589_18920 [Myxococcota bacterium]|nr:hypothetical protein [Myxococcota bacterium]